MKPFHWNTTTALWRAYLEATPALPQLDRWLAREFKQNPKFGKQDRAWYSEALFAASRFGLLAGFLHLAARRIAEGGQGYRLTDEDLAALRARLTEAGASPKRSQAFLASIGAEEFFFHVLKRAGLGPLPSGGSDRWDAVYRYAEGRFPTGALWQKALWFGLPPWAESALEARARRSGWNSEELDAFVRAQESRPPLWLRINSAERERPEVEARVTEELIKYGFKVKKVEENPFALAAYGEKPIFELESFKKGLFEIQDLASQGIGQSVEAKPGNFIWDACAGAGGKTMQMASKLANRGAVYATDIREHALDDARGRVKRAGFQNVRFMTWNGEGLPEFGPELRNRKGFDWVLVDAPCSASGTWRRNPDAKYRFGLPAGGGGARGPLLSLTSADELVTGDRTAEDFALTQLKLLREASGAVKPGGHLVYGTCSFLVEENESVVEAFLAAEHGFELVREGLHGSPKADADTTYSAVLRKR